jgi:hypothetical protein
VPSFDAEHSPLLGTLVRGPAELLLGSAAGLAVGLLGCLFLPPGMHKDDPPAPGSSIRPPPHDEVFMVRPCSYVAIDCPRGWDR